MAVTVVNVPLGLEQVRWKNWWTRHLIHEIVMGANEVKPVNLLVKSDFAEKSVLIKLRERSHLNTGAKAQAKHRFQTDSDIFT